MMPTSPGVSPFQGEPVGELAHPGLARRRCAPGAAPGYTVAPFQGEDSAVLRRQASRGSLLRIDSRSQRPEAWM